MRGQSAEGHIFLWDWGKAGKRRQVFGEIVWEEGVSEKGRTQEVDTETEGTKQDTQGPWSP